MAGVRPGAIILTRHGEPALSRKCLITARQYGDWWARYEVGGLLAGQTPPPELIAAAQGAGAIYASTRQRAQETAAAVAAGREVMSDVMFIEAPLPPPPVPEWIRLSPKWWGVVSRFWWHAFDHHDGQETRAQAEARAAQAARKLIARAEGGQDVLGLRPWLFQPYGRPRPEGRRLETGAEPGLQILVPASLREAMTASGVEAGGDPL